MHKSRSMGRICMQIIARYGNCHTLLFKFNWSLQQLQQKYEGSAHLRPWFVRADRNSQSPAHLLFQVTAGWCPALAYSTSARASSTESYPRTRPSRPPTNTQAFSDFDYGGVVNGWRSSSTTVYPLFTADLRFCKLTVPNSSGRDYWKRPMRSKLTNYQSAGVK